MSKVYVVGLGPGADRQMTLEARAALDTCQVIVGYTVYVDLIKQQYPEKTYLTTPMTQEVKRCRMALDEAAGGRDVAMVCSGDAGIYGMAGLILEIVTKEKRDIQVRVVPGITASIAAASLLGAPLMHDFCHISLSDLLTPWEVIEKRIKAAAEADFVICFYNPRSLGREGHLARAFELMAPFKAATTPIGVVKAAARKKEEKWITTFGEMEYDRVDMTSLVIVGNKSTYISDDLMITPRGYKL